jgi:hypothetical protein
MDSPADGDELARVVPLRRRDRELTATPIARGTLPRERAPFDPELDAFDIPSGHRLPRGSAIRVVRFAFRSRRGQLPRDQAAGTRVRHHSPTLLRTGAGVAGLATVAALALLSSILSSSSSPATQVGSLGGRVTAGALEPPETDVLSASGNPFGGGSDTRVAKDARALAPSPDRARPGRRRARVTHTHSGMRSPGSKGDQSVVVAAYTPGTSAASTHNAAAETQSPPITISSPSPVSTSAPRQSTSTARATSSSGSTTHRPAFGEQGLLGPGSSPDS